MKKINVLRPRDENAILSGSDGQNYQPGWCPHSIKYLLSTMKVHACSETTPDMKQ